MSNIQLTEVPGSTLKEMPKEGETIADYFDLDAFVKGFISFCFLLQAC